MEFIDLKTQYNRFKEQIDARIHTVLDHGMFIMGPEIDEIETILANYVGVKHCISVASGTDSLEIALRALNIGPGDEVITVPFSWISSAEVILQVGAKPVFVDIDPLSYTLNPKELEKAITNNTKAIIAVSLFGQMPELESINMIAEPKGIRVIEDAAQSFGATRNGLNSCGASYIGSTSFFPAKPFGCYGDGGALFTDDDEIANKMRAIRTHGGLIRHHHTLVGMNGRFDTLQAAILLAKWPYFKDEVIKRNRIGAIYSEKLQGFVKTPCILPGNTHVYGQYTIEVEADKRNYIQENLEKAGIPTGVYYPKCFHEQPVFEPLGYKLGDFPHSEKAANCVLSLPMHPYLSLSDIDCVVENVSTAIL